MTSPDTRGDDLTLQALNVSDANGTPTLVEFYDDANNNDLLGPGVDTLLGTDTNGADGWAATVNTTTWTAGQHKELRKSDISEHFECSKETARRDLKDLRRRGLIEFVGPSKTGHWRRVG